MLYLYGKSGTTYLYIHLNNDVTKGNDNRGQVRAGHGVRKRLEGRPVGRGGRGDRLRRQLGRRRRARIHTSTSRCIPNDGGAANPYPYLMKAERLIFATAPATTVTLTVTGNVIQASTGQLTMKVTKLQAFPAGAVLDKMRRPLKLGVAETVQVDLGQQGRRREVGSEAPRSRSGRAHRADRGDARSRRRTPGRVQCRPRRASR